LANGLVFAMGRCFTNQAVNPVLALRVTASAAVLETPAQDPESIPFVRLMLERASSLSPPPEWLLCEPELSGGAWRVTVPGPPEQHFFRLRAVPR
jgi:hypothetical protein